MKDLIWTTSDTFKNKISEAAEEAFQQELAESLTDCIRDLSFTLQTDGTLSVIDLAFEFEAHISLQDIFEWSVFDLDDEEVSKMRTLLEGLLRKLDGERPENLNNKLIIDKPYEPPKDY